MYCMNIVEHNISVEYFFIILYFQIISYATTLHGLVISLISIPANTERLHIFSFKLNYKINTFTQNYKIIYKILQNYILI